MISRSWRYGPFELLTTLDQIWILLHYCFYNVLPLISLSQLNSSAQLTAAVQLISLSAARLRTSSQCLTAGWGDVGDNNTLPNRLQEVNVTTLPQRTCCRRWQGVPITRAMVCGVGGRAFQGFCSVREHAGSTSISTQTFGGVCAAGETFSTVMIWVSR